MKLIKSVGFARICALLMAAALAICLLPEPAQAAGFAAIVTSSGMKAYTDSALTNFAGTVPKDEVVIVNGYSGSVASITYAQRNGYALVTDMARVSDVCKKAKVSVNNATAYESKSTSSRSVSLKKGFPVYLVDVDGKWARIAAGSHVGYTNIDWLTVEGETAATPTPVVSQSGGWITAEVSAASVKVYSAPSTGSTLLTTLKKGVQLNVVDYTSTWAHVEKNGYYGYCSTKALKPASNVSTPAPTPTPTPSSDWIAATVSAASVKVYAAANAGSTVLGTLKKGTQVNVLDYTSTWAHIELKGYYGYCSVSALTKAATPTASPTPKNAIPATVTADSVKVYASASTSAKSLGTLPKGTQVNVVDANSTWAFIELNGRYGFCKRTALTRTSDLAPTVQFTATVVYPNAPVYASKSTQEGAASTTLSIGTTVDVYAYDDTWAAIGKDGTKGFILVKYLNHDNFVERAPGDSGDAVLTLQKSLEKLGYFDGVPGGNYSTMTTDAVKRLQGAVGLTATGNADLVTLRLLASGNAPTSPLLNASLSKGSNGANVTRLQTRLLAKGYLSKSGSVDGDYGSTTAAAVKLFQKKAGITESGTADSATLKALYANDAPALGSGAQPADATVTPTPTSSAPITSTDTPGNNAKIETVITAAKNQLGKPYVYGAMGMSSFDCSGLTSYAFKQVGITLNRTAYGQGYNDGVKIEGLSNLVRGDIVCMNTISDSDLSDHVGIYLGGGQMIHASSGAGKVIISSLTSGYYNRVFSWGRRIIQ